MAGKKKKPVANPARGFATVSVASKSKHGINEDSAEDMDASKPAKSVEQQPERHGHHGEGSNPLVDTDRMGPEELERQLEEHELQHLVDTHLDKASKISSRLISKIRYDRKVIREQANYFQICSWCSDQTFRKVLDASRLDLLNEDSFPRDRFVSGQRVEEEIVVDLWSLQQVLQSLSIGSESLNEALARSCHSISTVALDTEFYGLEQCLEWLVVKRDPQCVVPYDRDSHVKPSAETGSVESKSRADGHNNEEQDKSSASSEKGPSLDELAREGATHESEREDLSNILADVSDIDSDLDPTELADKYVSRKAILFSIAPDHPECVPRRKKLKKDKKQDLSSFHSGPNIRKIQLQLNGMRNDALFDIDAAEDMWQSRKIDLLREYSRDNQESIRSNQSQSSKGSGGASDIAGLKGRKSDEESEVIGSDGEDSSNEDFLGGMFQAINETELAGYQKSENPTGVTIRAFTEVDGIKPRKILEDFVKTRKLKARLSYLHISSTDYSSRHAIRIFWESKSDLHLKIPSSQVVIESASSQITKISMIGIATPSRIQSEGYISVAVLFSLVHALGAEDKSFLRMAPLWRDLYQEFGAEKKKKVDLEHRSNLRSLRDMIRQESRADNDAEPKWQEIDKTDRFEEKENNDPADKYVTNAPYTNPDEAKSEWYRRKKSPTYQRMLRYRDTLPISEYRHEILSTIHSHQVTIVCGETGCGKSTQLPSYILEDAFEHGLQCKIICTEPRRISAVSLAQRVSEELGEGNTDIGTSRSIIGYAIRLESKFTARTRLVYATVGIVLRMLETNQNLDGVSHLIIDEVHERSIDTDFLLIIIKLVMRSRPDLKLILMSATVDAQKFSQYLDNAPVVMVPGRTYPVLTKYLEDAYDFVGEKAPSAGRVDREMTYPEGVEVQDPDFSGRSDQRNMDKLDEYRIDFNLIINLIEKVVYEPGYSVYSKAFLIFLPGLSEIRRLHDLLRTHPKFDQSWHIHPLHSSLSSKEQQSVFKVPPVGQRKIVIATNIAETGVTIPDITCVIDSGKHKEMRYDERRQMSRLIQSFVSKANATQRRGRAGRVQEGLCFHLFTKSRYEESMAAQQTPEMLRLSLQELVMRTKICNLGEIEATLASALDPPSPKNIRRAINALIEVGALTQEEALTPLGQQLAKFPLDAQLGKLILYANAFGVMDSALTMAAILSTKSPFFIPFGGAAEAQLKHRTFNKYSSDLLSVYTAYSRWKAVCQDPSLGSPTEFCRRFFLSSQTLADIEELKAQLLQCAVEGGLMTLTDDESRSPKHFRSSRFGSQAFVSVPKAHDENGSNDFLICTVISAAFYPRILAREGKGWRNIATNQHVALHPRSVANSSSPTAIVSKYGFFSYHSTLQSSSRPHAMELTPTSPIMLIMLSNNVEFRIASGLVILDSGRVKWKVRTWEECVALKHLHARTRDLLKLSFEVPRKPLETKLKDWRDVILAVFSDADNVTKAL